jgi:hypothetical protein
MVQSVLTFLFGLISLIFVSTTLIYRHKFQVLQVSVIMIHFNVLVKKIDDYKASLIRQ